ncbi:MAG: hypothetical protein HYW78_00085 [Parcubacteria group bacterium]|nr:hypothetical protein [Parcubacteria group bacterium]
MWKNIFGYLKCVWVNKATLWGYILLVSFSVQMIFTSSWWRLLGMICLYISITLLGMTLGGIQTYVAYKMTRRAICRNGKEKYKLFMPDFYTYCGIKGVRLAEKEAGITK